MAGCASLRRQACARRWSPWPGYSHSTPHAEAVRKAAGIESARRYFGQADRFSSRRLLTSKAQNAEQELAGDLVARGCCCPYGEQARDDPGPNEAARVVIRAAGESARPRRRLRPGRADASRGHPPRP
mmetsp:Transcript_23378/g.88762  ORF Transcript_23378/g.88762 Transcript_23378/m.88762 type:complete len:128 (-) Transcript_23378:933-1316(-)